MNSTIFVQPSPGIPAGPLEDIKSDAGTTKPASIAAVIRPAPQDSGLEGSLRIDSASTEIGRTHIRTHQLDDYVNWLREKVRTDRLSGKTSQPASTPVHRAETAQRTDTHRAEAPTTTRVSPQYSVSVKHGPVASATPLSPITVSSTEKSPAPAHPPQKA